MSKMFYICVVEYKVALDIIKVQVYETHSEVQLLSKCTHEKKKVLTLKVKILQSDAVKLLIAAVAYMLKH